MAKKKKPAKKVAKAAPKKKAPPKKAAKPAKKAAAPKKAAKPAKATKPVKAAKPAAAKKAPMPVSDKKAAKSGKADSKKAATKVTATELQPVEPEAEETEPVEVVLTDAEGRRYCRTRDCDQLAIVDGYCRYHYLLFWKKIQVRKKILTEGKLERYIEELTSRYPDKYLDMLKKDLRSEKDFLAAIQELEIDESAVDAEFEDEAQNYIDEVRGMGEATSTREEEDF